MCHFADLRPRRPPVLPLFFAQGVAGSPRQTHTRQLTKCSLRLNSIWYNVALYYASSDKDIDNAYQAGKELMPADAAETPDADARKMSPRKKGSV